MLQTSVPETHSIALFSWIWLMHLFNETENNSNLKIFFLQVKFEKVTYFRKINKMDDLNHINTLSDENTAGKITKTDNINVNFHIST